MSDSPTTPPNPFPSIIVAEEADRADASDGHDVELVSHVETVGAVMDVAVVGDYAYVADREVGLQVVDLSSINDLAGPASSGAMVSHLRPPGAALACDLRQRDALQRDPSPGKGVRARRLAIQGDRLYLVGWGALQIVDIALPGAPRALGALPMEGLAPLDVAVAGDYAYVANGTGGVCIVDVSDPTAPNEVVRYALEDTYVAGLAVGDDQVYAAASSAGLRIVDLSDPLHPVEEASHTTPLPAWDVALVWNRAFVVWNLRGAAGGPQRGCGSGVTVLDVRLPEAPEEIGQICDPSRHGISDLAVVKRTAYVAAGERGIRVLDISNLTAPIEVGFYDTPGDALRIAAQGDELYVADGEGGLFVLRFTPNGFPANRDGNVRLGISRPSYALSERIEVEIVILGEGITLHGPCDRWFERETDQGWRKVGECPETAFTDEPYPQRPGNRIRASLPISDTDNVYHYNYSLTPGIYRYVLRYWTPGGSETVHSPPFEVVGD